VHPFLFEVPGSSVRVPAYGLFIALSFLLGYAFLLWESRRQAPERLETIAGSFPWIILSSLVGSRLFFALFERPAEFVRNPIGIVSVWHGGHVYYGGLIGAVLACVWYCRRNRISFPWFADIAIGGVALGQTAARIGCFLAGCCWGRAADVPWAVTFTHPESLCGLRDVAVHPAQIYQALANLLTFAVCLQVLRSKRFDGEVLLWYGVVYSIGRFTVEIFRDGTGRAFVIPGLLSLAQFISLLILLASALLLLRSRGRAAADDAPA